MWNSLHKDVEELAYPPPRDRDTGTSIYKPAATTQPPRPPKKEGFDTPGGTHYTIGGPSSSSSSYSEKSYAYERAAKPNPNPNPNPHPQNEGFQTPGGTYYPPAQSAVRERLAGSSSSYDAPDSNSPSSYDSTDYSKCNVAFLYIYVYMFVSLLT